MAWLDVEAFDCCTCLYVCTASAVCDFLISAGIAEVDERRMCIKFCVRLGKTGSETFEMLKQAFGDSCMSRSRTFEWFGRCNKLTRKTLTSSLFVLKNTGISLNFRVK